MHTRVTF